MKAGKLLTVLILTLLIGVCTDGEMEIGPDRILFTAAPESEFGYIPRGYVMNLEGDYRKILIGSNSTWSCKNLRWSPDGKKITYCSSDYFVSHPIDLTYVSDLDGSDSEYLGSGSYPIWSPDGERVTFTCCICYYCGSQRLYSMDLSSGYLKNMTPFETIWTSDWSPDGTRILFISSGDSGVKQDIYRVDSSGANVTKVTSDTVSWGYPRWLDNNTIVTVIGFPKNNQEYQHRLVKLRLVPYQCDTLALPSGYHGLSSSLAISNLTRRVFVLVNDDLSGQRVGLVLDGNGNLIRTAKIPNLNSVAITDWIEKD